MADVVKRHRNAGRPSNEDQKAKGKLATVKSCKICNSPFKNEITAELLSKTMSGEKIREKYNREEYFKTAPLNATNIHSHKKHSSPEMLAEIDFNKKASQDLVTGKVKDVTEYSPLVQSLYAQNYDATIDKLSVVDNLFKQRLNNLWEVQRELEDLKTKRAAGELINPAVIYELVISLESALDSLSSSMTKQMKVEQGPAQKSVNIIFIDNVKSHVEKFIKAFVDVLVEEIVDPIIRSRVKDKFIEKLDQNIAPVLDPTKMIEGKITVVEDSLK